MWGGGDNRQTIATNLSQQKRERIIISSAGMYIVQSDLGKIYPSVKSTNISLVCFKEKLSKPTYWRSIIVYNKQIIHSYAHNFTPIAQLTGLNCLFTVKPPLIFFLPLNRTDTLEVFTLASGPASARITSIDTRGMVLATPSQLFPTRLQSMRCFIAEVYVLLQMCESSAFLRQNDVSFLNVALSVR